MSQSDIITYNRGIVIPESRLEKPLENKHGRYWNSIKDVVFAITDLRVRAGHFTSPWNDKIDPLYALPPLVAIPDKFNDIVDERALELNAIAKIQNKRIVIWWSGGIDSTLVLAAFVKNLSAEDLQRVSVLLSSESIEEHPQFYKNIIRNKIHCIPYLEFKLTNDTLNNSIVLSGDPADCLFGPSVSMYSHLISEGRHLLPFNDNRKLIANTIEMRSLEQIKRGNLEGFGKWYVDKISDNILDVAPDGVETIADWWWWHYINFKWEFSISRPMMRRRVDGIELAPIDDVNVQSFIQYTFFNTARFQQWSYTNLKNLIGNSLSNHKKAARDYIYELDQDEVYRDTKIKRESVPYHDNSKIRRLRRPFIWDKNWQGYYGIFHKELFRECIDCLENFKG
jgi:hypothetical protein